MLIFHSFSIVLMHDFFLLNGPPTFFLSPPALLLLHLGILSGKRVLELLLHRFVILHLSLNVLLVGYDFLKFSVFYDQGLLPLLQFVQKSMVVVTPA